MTRGMTAFMFLSVFPPYSQLICGLAGEPDVFCLFLQNHFLPFPTLVSALRRLIFRNYKNWFPCLLVYFWIQPVFKEDREWKEGIYSLSHSIKVSSPGYGPPLKIISRTSLAVQWLWLMLPRQGAQVCPWSGNYDSTHCVARKSFLHSMVVLAIWCAFFWILITTTSSLSSGLVVETAKLLGLQRRFPLFSN